MSLGLCCHYLDQRGHNLTPFRTLQLSRWRQGCYTQDFVEKLYCANLHSAARLLKFAVIDGIASVRISSALLPLADQVSQEWWNNDKIKGLLKELGYYAKKHNLRITCHPGQHVSLASGKCLEELMMAAWIFDGMNLPSTPYYAINVHGGKGNLSERIIEQISKLPTNVRNRLTLENDEFSYSLEQLLSISQATQVPLVCDVHHHSLNPGKISVEQALDLAFNTWSGIKPLVHLSNSRYPGVVSKTQLRQHSDYIWEIPASMRELHTNGLIDIDIEAKMKNLAIDRLLTENLL